MNLELLTPQQKTEVLLVLQQTEQVLRHRTGFNWTAEVSTRFQPQGEAMSVEEFIDFVITLCAQTNGVEVHQLKSKRRKREMVTARQQAAAILCECTKLSLKRIGVYLGGADHSTVIHSKQTVSDMCETDRKYREGYENLLRICRQKRVVPTCVKATVQNLTCEN